MQTTLKLGQPTSCTRQVQRSRTNVVKVQAVAEMEKVTVNARPKVNSVLSITFQSWIGFSCCANAYLLLVIAARCASGYPSGHPSGK